MISPDLLKSTSTYIKKQTAKLEGEASKFKANTSPILSEYAKGVNQFYQKSKSEFMPQMQKLKHKIETMEQSYPGRIRKYTIIAGIGAIAILSFRSCGPFKQKTQVQYNVYQGHGSVYSSGGEYDFTNYPIAKKENFPNKCLKSKENAISQSELSKILSTGGKVITQGGQIRTTVEPDSWLMLSDVSCFFIPYIIEK